MSLQYALNCSVPEQPPVQTKPQFLSHSAIEDGPASEALAARVRKSSRLGSQDKPAILLILQLEERTESI